MFYVFLHHLEFVTGLLPDKRTEKYSQIRGILTFTPRAILKSRIIGCFCQLFWWPFLKRRKYRFKREIRPKFLPFDSFDSLFWSIGPARVLNPL
jgi:hypothetical protein